MANVVIFGVGDCASLAHHYLQHDSPHNVVGFTVHRNYLPVLARFEGLPVIDFETLEADFPPQQVSAIAPLSARRINRVREEIYLSLKERGYPLISYISSRASHFPNTAIGDNCFILESVTIQLFASIGNNVVLWSGSHVGHHSLIGDHAFFAPHAVTAGHCKVESHCFLGTNSTVRDHITLGQGTLVGMGAIVSRDTAPWTVYKAGATSASDVSSINVDL